MGSDLSAARSATSPAQVEFRLTDPEGDPAAVELRFRASPEEPLEPMTLVGGSVSELSTLEGATHAVEWDFETDLGGPGFHADVEIALEVVGGISPPSLAGVTQGNDPPSVAFALEPTEERAGVVPLSFTIDDTGGDSQAVRVQFNTTEGFPEADWQDARPAGLDPGTPTPEISLGGVRPSSGPIEFGWDTGVDLPEFDGTAGVRVLATDPFGLNDTVSAVAEVDNNQVPVIEISQLGLALSEKKRRRIPIPFRVSDREADELRIVAQWAPAGEIFPTLPTDRDELVALLDDPAREQDRRTLRIGRERPFAFRGRIGNGGAGVLELPELTSSANALIAHGLVGRTVQVSRRNDLFVALQLDTPLQGIADCAVDPSDETALVLLQAGAGSWELRRHSLFDGSIVSSLATGAGDPRAFAVSPDQSRVFLTTTSEVLQVDVDSGQVIASAALSLSGSSGCLAARTADEFLVCGVRPDQTGEVLRGVMDGSGGAAFACLATDLIEPAAVALLPDGRTAVVADSGQPQLLVIDLIDGSSRGLTLVEAEPGNADTVTIASSPVRHLSLNQGNGELLALEDGPNGLAIRRVVTGPCATEFSDPDCNGWLSTSRPTDGVAAAAGVHPRPAGGAVAWSDGDTALSVRGGLAWQGVIGETAGQSELAFDPVASTVAIADEVGSLPGPGAPWSIEVSVGTTPGNRSETVWSFGFDADDAGSADRIGIRLIAVDADVGDPSESEVSVEIGGLFETSADQPLFGPEAFDVARLRVDDLDGDGDQDVVLVGNAVGEASPFAAVRTQGTGLAFAPAVPLNAGELGPSALLALNHDVLVSSLDPNPARDLVLVHTVLGEPDTVEVFLNPALADGVAPIDPSQKLDLPGTVDAVALVDLQGGAAPALVYLDASTMEIVVHRPDEAPQTAFQAAEFQRIDVSALTPGPSGRFSIESVDANLDAQMDILVWLSEPPAFAVLEQSVDAGIGTLLEPSGLIAVPGLEEIQDLLVADLAPPLGEEVQVFGVSGACQLLSATGTALLAFQVQPSEDPSASLHVVELGDGALREVVITNGGFLEVVDFVSGPSGALQVITSFEALEGDGIASGAVTDFDLDGAPDVLTLEDSPRLLRGTSPGTLSRLTTSGATLGALGVDMGIADVNRDGLEDIVTLQLDDGADGVLLVRHQRPGPELPSVPSFVASVAGSPTCLAVGDVNSDGFVDLAVGSANATDGQIELYLNAGGAGFDPPISVTVTPPPAAVAIGDVDSDGARELVVGSLSPNSPSQPSVFVGLGLNGGVLEVDPGVTFEGLGPSPVSSLTQIVLADLDGDGDLDAVLGTNLSPDIVWVPGTGDGEFRGQDAGKVNPFGFSDELAVVDIDGDDWLDILSANSFTGFVQVLLSRAPTGAAFADFFVAAGVNPALQFDEVLDTRPAFPTAAVAADISLSGRPDIITGIDQSEGLRIHRDLVAGVYEPTGFGLEGSIVGAEVIRLEAVDLDRDGEPELIALTSLGARVEVFGSR